jgi:hypothetical protein
MTQAVEGTRIIDEYLTYRIMMDAPTIPL